MRKALVLALCLGVASATSGLEAKTNISDRVSAIATDNRSIKSESKGKIALSKEACADFLRYPALLGKVAYSIGVSPYTYSTNTAGEITFADKNKSLSTLKYIKDSQTPESARKEVEIKGSRHFSTMGIPHNLGFNAYIDLNCKENEQNEVDYTTQMHILFENKFDRLATRVGLALPYYGPRIKQMFKDEQDSVGKMMQALAEKMKEDPKKFFEQATSPTNTIPTTKEENQTLEELMRKHKFWK